MELLIVIAIIGISIAIAVPLFAGKLREAKVATNKADIRSAKAVAAAQYYTDESGSLPAVTKGEGGKPNCFGPDPGKPS